LARVAGPCCMAPPRGARGSAGENNGAGVLVGRAAPSRGGGTLRAKDRGALKAFRRGVVDHGLLFLDFGHGWLVGGDGRCGVIKKRRLNSPFFFFFFFFLFYLSAVIRAER